MANETWASDANFPAGTDPWSAQPTKVAPDVGEIAAGHTPGVPVPAETENWWKNRTDTRLSTLDADTVTFAMGPSLVDDGGVLAFLPAAGNPLNAAKFTGAGSALFAFQLAKGRTLLGFAVLALGDTAADLTVAASVPRAIDGGNLFTIDPAGVNNLPAAFAQYDFTITEVDAVPATEYLVVDGDILLFAATASAANIAIHTVILFYEPA